MPHEVSHDTRGSNEVKGKEEGRGNNTIERDKQPRRVNGSQAEGLNGLTKQELGKYIRKTIFHQVKFITTKNEERVKDKVVAALSIPKNEIDDFWSTNYLFIKSALDRKRNYHTRKLVKAYTGRSCCDISCWRRWFV